MLGPPPFPPVAGRYFVQTFGCQMNVHDSERMEEVLVAHGWRPVPGPEDADLVVFNTCSVREKAEQKLRSEVGKLAPLKQRNPDLVLCVAGCVAQQEGERLLQRVAHIDLVVGPDNLAELPLLALAQRAGAPPLARTEFDLDEPRFLAASPAPGAAPVSAFVTTMKGCDERCSFCIVPHTRGPERYRPVAEILEEVRRWVSAGTREVVLLGQTVDSYRDQDLPALETGDPDESQFPALLRLLASRVAPYDPSHPERHGLARLRYTSPHPRHATPSLARAHAELDVLARHVHLPVQSGSDRVLRRMIRRYTRAEFLERAARLRSARKGLTLSTDIVVGFPGETESDFLETLSVVREVGFTALFGFKFSPRPHTPALRLADDVPEETKSERLARLFEVSEAQGREHLASLVGTRQYVLIEGTKPGPPGDGARAGLVSGRTAQNEIVHLEAPDGRSAVGCLAEVEIVRANKHSLAAHWTREAVEAMPTKAPAPRAAKRVLPLAPAEKRL